MAHGARAEWMHQGKWGFFLHFLAGAAGSGDGSGVSPEDWNRRVDGFDVQGLAAQAAQAGAAWVGLTIGQNSGHYCSPNPVYDAITGIAPSRCSRRDLIADLHAALAPRGIRLMAYLPAGAPESDPTAVAALGWRKAARCADFQRRWESVIRCWSERWGDRVSAWWFDGCYWNDLMYRSAEAPNFASFAAAARAGNPAAAVAWNPGVSHPPRGVDAEEDYTSGEVNEPDLVDAPGRWMDGEQFHVLTYLGRTWGTGPLRFDGARAAALTRGLTDHGGAVTWDVPFGADGRLADTTLATLAAVGGAVNPTRSRPDLPPPDAPEVRLAFARVPEPGKPGLARLTLRNHQQRASAGSVRAWAEPAGAVRIAAPDAIGYHLQPGAESCTEFAVEVLGDSPAHLRQLVVERSADGRRIPFPLPVRQRLQLPTIAAEDPAALPAAMAAIPARTLVSANGRALAELRLARAGGDLAVLCQAFDAEPVRTRGLWDGSCLELFAAMPGGPVRQILVAPPAAGQPATAMLVQSAERHHDPALADARVRMQADAVPGGWRLAVLVPLAWWLDAPAVPERYLIDAIVGAAGARAGLCGGLTAAQSSDSYGLVG